MAENANDPTPGGTLSGLIEIELGIEAAVARAESDAARRIAAVRDEVRAAAKETEAADADSLQALHDRVAQECAETIRGIDEQATADVERYRRLDERALRELAGWVAAEVAGGGVPEK